MALPGPSGVGKSLLMLQLAGLSPSTSVLLNGARPDALDEDTLRARVSMLPQRSSLLAGTVRDNLSLSGEFTDAQMWRALQTVALADVFEARDGLETQLGDGGSGLSGGQSRRLALARNILKKSDILLLDAPTEGLDAATAEAVLQGIREALPDALIIAATHDRADDPRFDRTINLSQQVGDIVTKT